MEKKPENNGAKVGATAIIWSLATGIMAICIPLVKISQSGVILPLALIVGVSISTVVIWLSGNQKAITSSKEIQQIEQRVRNLETICSSDNFDLNDKFKQLKKSIKT